MSLSSQQAPPQPTELNIELYFWMIDRGDLQDDQRNQVSVQRQKVVLH